MTHEDVELIITKDEPMPDHDVSGVTRDGHHWELAIYVEDGDKGPVVTPARLHDVITILEAQAKLLEGKT